MKQRKSGKQMVSEVMGEKILLGGEILTRADAYRGLIVDGHSPRCADYFAFGTKPYRDIEDEDEIYFNECMKRRRE